MCGEWCRTLTNKDIIAINQDKLGIQAMKWMDEGNIQVFVKPLANDEYAFLYLNRSDVPVTYSFNWPEHYMQDDLSKRSIHFDKQRFNWRELWTGETGSTKEPLKLEIPAHGVKVMRFTPTK